MLHDYFLPDFERISQVASTGDRAFLLQSDSGRSENPFRLDAGYAIRKTIGIVAPSNDVLSVERDNVALSTISFGFQDAEEEIRLMNSWDERNKAVVDKPLRVEEKRS